MIAVLTTLAVVAHTLLGCCGREWQRAEAIEQPACCHGHDHAPQGDLPPHDGDHDCHHTSCKWTMPDDHTDVPPLLTVPALYSLGEIALLADASDVLHAALSQTSDALAPPVRLHLAHCVLLI